MAIIPDNSGTPGEHLEQWAVQHMARDVLFEVLERERICRSCPQYGVHHSKLFVMCDGRQISLAGESCPEGKW